MLRLPRRLESYDYFGEIDGHRQLRAKAIWAASNCFNAFMPHFHRRNAFHSTHDDYLDDFRTSAARAYQSILFQHDAARPGQHDSAPRSERGDMHLKKLSPYFIRHAPDRPSQIFHFICFL